MTNHPVARLIAMSLPVLAFLASQAVFNAPAHADPPSTAVLNDQHLPLQSLSQVPIPQSEVTPEQIEKIFPGFSHVPFETSGFNPVSLPFRFNSPDNSGDPAEAYGFAFLLSSTLDWVPGCYCSRHAFFVFEQDPALKDLSIDPYTPATIKAIIQRWEATCAVGGTLTHSAKGYSGVLEVYDPDGKAIRKTAFKEPRSIFKLLGDMTIEVIHIQGQEPSKALKDFLWMERYKNPQSLIDLGKAGMLPYHSKLEFDFYDQILKNDPGFADVRVFSANQRFWMDGDNGVLNEQLRKALDSYPVSEALRAVEPYLVNDATVFTKVNKWIQNTTDLTQDTVPQLLYLRLQTRMGINSADLERHLKIAHDNPNSYLFLCGLSTYLHRPEPGYSDLDLSASLCLCAALDRYVQPTDTCWAIHRVADDLMTLGYDDEALRLYLRNSNPDEVHDWLMNRILCMTRLGYAPEAVKAFEGLPVVFTPNEWEVGYAAQAAIVMGDSNALRRIVASHDKILNSTMVESYRRCADVMDGKKPVQELDKSLNNVFYAYLPAQMDLLLPQPKMQQSVGDLLQKEPGDRLLRGLFDRYQKFNPTPDGADFYMMISWFNPRDPIGLAYHPGPYEAPVDPANVQAILKPYENVRWMSEVLRQVPVPYIEPRKLRIWTVVSAIRQLMLKGKVAEAHDLALRYHCMLSRGYMGESSTLFLANHLIHLTDPGNQVAAGK